MSGYCAKCFIKLRNGQGRHFNSNLYCFKHWEEAKLNKAENKGYLKALDDLEKIKLKQKLKYCKYIEELKNGYIVVGGSTDYEINKYLGFKGNVSYDLSWIKKQREVLK